MFWSPGIPRAHFHALRHTFATMLLASQKEDLFSVSRALGHSDVSTTADVYGHWTPEAAERAAASVEDLLKPRKAKV